MRLPNDDIRRRILGKAKLAFHRDGFLKASMRDIASQAGISVGNVYHYFGGKDALFRAVVQPVVSRFHLLLEEHHGTENSDIGEMLTEEYQRKVTEEWLTLVHRHRTLLDILFFKAQGSSLERFKEEFTDEATAQVKLWLSHEKTRYEGLHTTVTDFFLHMHSVWMFSLLEEVIMHDIHGEDLERAMEEYMKFEITGWKLLFNL